MGDGPFVGMEEVRVRDGVEGVSPACNNILVRRGIGRRNIMRSGHSSSTTTTTTGTRSTRRRGHVGEVKSVRLTVHHLAHRNREDMHWFPTHDVPHFNHVRAKYQQVRMSIGEADGFADPTKDRRQLRTGPRTKRSLLHTLPRSIHVQAEFRVANQKFIFKQAKIGERCDMGGLAGERQVPIVRIQEGLRAQRQYINQFEASRAPDAQFRFQKERRD